MRPYHPRIPWVTFQPHPRGGFVVLDTRTGQQAYAPNEPALHAFAADHSAPLGRSGMGDAVRAVTKRLGVGECSPCARRQALMNASLPSFRSRR
jgi:hypothetical protein